MSSVPRITSYINNLHPLKYKNLYRLIERVIDAAIPLWNMTLGPLESCDWSNYLRVEYSGSRKPYIKQPEPEKFEPPIKPDPTIDLKGDYAKSGLQVIVKLANIHLTPENPSYEGGSWHVEGQLVSFFYSYTYTRTKFDWYLVGEERIYMCDSPILLFQREH